MEEDKAIKFKANKAFFLSIARGDVLDVEFAIEHDEHVDLNKVYEQVTKSNKDETIVEFVTPLKKAIQYEDAVICRILINAGASVSKTKKYLNHSQIGYLDAILSEMLICELSKPYVNIRLVIKLLEDGASLLYPKNPLMSFIKNAHLTDRVCLEILEKILKFKYLEAEILEQLKRESKWVALMSNFLFQRVYQSTKTTDLQILLDYGARFDYQMPYESSELFLLDEEIHKTETAFEKANRMHLHTILDLFENAREKNTLETIAVKNIG